MMMVPEAWRYKKELSPSKRAFYEFQSALMEPWDGPAMMAFTDGRYVGACLDRNGLRPSRYYVTNDDRVLLSSEVGVLVDLAEDLVVTKARLEPGKMLLIDFEQERIIPRRRAQGVHGLRPPLRRVDGDAAAAPQRLG